MREIVFTSSQRLEAEVIPGDGDCLFAALARQWSGMDVTSDVFVEVVAGFRKEVVMYLRRNSEMLRLKHCIISRIANEFPLLVCKSNGEKVLLLTDYLLLQGKWGGEETIIATTEMFNIAVNVFYESGNPILFNPSIGMPHGMLNVVYRLAGYGVGIYNHYDSFSLYPVCCWVCFRLFSGFSCFDFKW